MLAEKLYSIDSDLIGVSKHIHNIILNPFGDGILSLCFRLFVYFGSCSIGKCVCMCLCDFQVGAFGF